MHIYFNVVLENFVDVFNYLMLCINIGITILEYYALCRIADIELQLNYNNIYTHDKAN